MQKILSAALIAAAAIVAPSAANAAVQITEFTYQGAASGNREFIELTNISDSSVDITNYWYDDDSRNPSVNFGALFGVLAAHESIIITEMSADAFRTYWGLDASVRVFGNNTVNLGSADEINIYSSSSAADLVDRVAYSGTTRGITRNRPVDATGTITNADFVDSALGDAFGSAFAPNSPADLGNPGRYPFTPPAAAVPEPATWAMMIGGFALVGAGLRRRKAAVRFA